METDKVDQSRTMDDEIFYNIVMTNLFSIYSPFEVGDEVDFPKKDELGGVVLKFIGGGAAYFKIQREMPSKEEVNSIYEIGKFLKETFGEYVVVEVLCMPHIEIRKIDLSDYEDMEIDFVSIRKSDGDKVLDVLMKKVKNNMKFSKQDHIFRIILPFMGRKDTKKFESKYSEFLNLFEKSNLDMPSLSTLLESDLNSVRMFSDDGPIYFSNV